MTLGQYLPVQSAIHRLDPRSKFVSAVFVIVAALTAGWAVLGAVALITVAGAYFSRIPPGVLWQQVKSLRFIIIITFLLQVILTPGDVIPAAGPLRITAQGLDAGLELLIRLLLVIFAGIILTATTSSLKLAAGMEVLFSPLGRLGIPVHEMVMAITISIRFIPVILEEARVIMNAQASRGAGFYGPGLARRAGAIVSLMVPLLTGAFRRSDELATAMEARCYRGGTGRTRMNVLSLSKGDVICMTASGITLVAAVLERMALIL
ncbi:MAG: energy-coupling factor transporter transmembrane component T family protein [Bacillota bacterium]